MQDQKEKTAVDTTEINIIGKGPSSVVAVNTLLNNGFILTDVKFLDDKGLFSYSLRPVVTELRIKMDSEINNNALKAMLEATSELRVSYF